jgi:hypothetical protein
METHGGSRISSNRATLMQQTMHVMPCRLNAAYCCRLEWASKQRNPPPPATSKADTGLVKSTMRQAQTLRKLRNGTCSHLLHAGLSASLTGSTAYFSSLFNFRRFGCSHTVGLLKP